MRRYFRRGHLKRAMAVYSLKVGHSKLHFRERNSGVNLGKQQTPIV
jgi:hypothetical protein